MTIDTPANAHKPLEDLKAISELMLEAAKQQNWDRLASLYTIEQALAKQLETLIPESQFPDPEAAKQLIIAINSCHRQTLEIIAPRRDEVGQHLASLYR